MKVPQVKVSAAFKKAPQPPKLPELAVPMGSGGKPRFVKNPNRKFSLQRAMLAKLRSFQNAGLMKGK